MGVLAWCRASLKALLRHKKYGQQSKSNRFSTEADLMEPKEDEQANAKGTMRLGYMTSAYALTN